MSEKADESIYEPLLEAEDAASVGLVLDSLRRREPSDNRFAAMETTISTSLPAEELAELDQLRRDRGVSRAEAIREAVRWYARWGDRLLVEDPTDEGVDP